MNKELKLLLYCTKAKNKYDRLVSDEHYGNQFYLYGAITENFESLNGKIVAECDFEVEEIRVSNLLFDEDYITNTFREKEILKYSCLTYDELNNYLQCKSGYSIHIKNLHIFDKPKELSEYSKRIGKDFQVLGKAPQNMMKCCEIKYMVKDYILISIRPQWLCKILNGEKTIEVRKKVLKEIKNE